MPVRSTSQDHHAHEVDLHGQIEAVVDDVVGDGRQFDEGLDAEAGVASSARPPQEWHVLGARARLQTRRHVVAAARRHEREGDAVAEGPHEQGVVVAGHEAHVGRQVLATR